MCHGGIAMVRGAKEWGRMERLHSILRCWRLWRTRKEWWVISQQSSCRSWTTELIFVAPPFFSTNPTPGGRLPCTDLCARTSFHIIDCAGGALFSPCGFNLLSKTRKINRGSSVSRSVAYPPSLLSERRRKLGANWSGRMRTRYSVAFSTLEPIKSNSLDFESHWHFSFGCCYFPPLRSAPNLWMEDETLQLLSQNDQRFVNIVWRWKISEWSGKRMRIFIDC